ncbi:hypothetical protein MACH09_45660 [Vibrio sp. MACH09]|uniref:DUF4400 domain-containing protein n=1 Tax=Vibrio sp. MACH09 TaxID=3025122 RepID=UPI00279356C9|nr:DUF4400 domain-containing protein [Vibrio sp. MACH09]GLO64058.1 hypothetical protein MACH09_45660 [Vibrio sp. MACH09]
MVQNKQDTQPKKTPTPLKWYQWPFAAIGHLLGIWCLLILFEWTVFLWGASVGEHAKEILFTQLSLMQNDYPGILNRFLPHLAWIIEQCNSLLALEFHGFFSVLTPYWHGVVYVTLALLARIALLIYAYPLFILAMFLGMFDGLVVRQRRTAFVARETETVHFYVKKTLPWVVMGSGYLWLFIPGIIAVPPSLLLLPGAILTGLLVQNMFASYKKFL